MEHQISNSSSPTIAIEVELEIEPMSVNQVWQGRRFKTPAYKDYEEKMLMIMPNKGTVEEEVEITYDFYVPDNRRRDISNYIKPLEDIIVKRGYIKDDSKVVEFKVKKHKSDKWKIRILIMRHSQTLNPL